MLTCACCTPGFPGHSSRDRLEDGRQVIRHQRHRLPGAVDQIIGHTAVLIPEDCLARQQRARTAPDRLCAPPGAAGRADDAGDGAAGAAVDAGLQGVPGGTHQARHQRGTAFDKHLQTERASVSRVWWCLLPKCHHPYAVTVQCTPSAVICIAVHGWRSALSMLCFPTQAPLLVDFRDNSNEAEIKMTLQFASTAKAQVGAHLKASQFHFMHVTRVTHVTCGVALTCKCLCTAGGGGGRPAQPAEADHQDVDWCVVRILSACHVMQAAGACHAYIVQTVQNAQANDLLVAQAT